MFGFGVLLVIITLMLVIKATSQPGFCVACHYMEPYFASWEESSHKHAHCTECHFPPGVKGTVVGKFTAIAMVANYFTGVYKKSKPWAEISDESCLRPGCHETRLLSGTVMFKEGILFDHAPHLLRDRRGKHLRCTSCHSQIVQGSHMTVTEETCFLCHFKDQSATSSMTSCTFCHEAPVATDSGEIIFDHADLIHKDVACQLCHGSMAGGDGGVPKERCSYCHAEIVKIEQYSQTIKIHELHVAEHKVECNRCHNTILHRSTARTGNIKPECQGCHIDRHLAQYSLFSGQGAVGLDPTPSTMFHAGLGCRACHILLPSDWKEHPDLAIRKAGAASCEPCHEKEYYSLYQQAKPVLNSRLNQTDSRIRQIKAQVKTATADSVISICTYNIDLLKRGKPIHNLEYADHILAEINRSLDKLEGKTPKPRSLPDSTSAGCIRCHYGQDEVSVPHEGRIFSHRNHVHNAKVGCTQCHLDPPQPNPNHGDLMSGTFCMDCHHHAAAVSCAPCHSAQRDLLAGTGVFAEFPADPMWEAGMFCRDCHEVEGTIVHRPDQDDCEMCHEPGYWDNMRVTQADFTKRIEVLKKSLDPGKHNPIITTLEIDGTKGAHNSSSIDELLKSLEAEILSDQ